MAGRVAAGARAAARVSPALCRPAGAGATGSCRTKAAADAVQARAGDLRVAERPSHPPRSVPPQLTHLN